MAHLSAEKAPASAKVAEPARPKAAPQVDAQRLSPPLTTQHYFGEQVIGSRETWQVGMPYNLDGDNATVRVHTEGDAFVLVSTDAPHTLPASRSSEASVMPRLAPVVSFRPRGRGDFRGALVISVRWSDGHTEVQRIVLRGAARGLDDVPHAQITDDERAEQARETAQSEREAAAKEAAATQEAKRSDSLPHSVNVAADGTDGYFHGAVRAAECLIDDQKRGLKLAEDEALSYQRAVTPPTKNVWLDIAKFGLTMAASGIGSAIGHALLSAFESKTEGAAAESGKQADERKRNPLEKAMVKGIEHGLKLAAEQALGVIEAKATPKTEASEQHAPGLSGHSANARIDFFAEQYRVLDDQKKRNGDVVNRQIHLARPHLRTDPAAVSDAFKKLTSTFEKQAGAAEQIQANATAQAWTSLVARVRHGTKSDATGTSANLDDLRRSSATARSRIDGVLDLTATSGPSPAIVSASLLGVSAEIVGRINERPLAELHVPMRIRFGAELHAPAVITRDEAGRVRVAGNLEALERAAGGRVGTTEEEAVAAATKIVSALLAGQSLKGLGIHVRHDDATGMGDETGVV
jgi:hypothetical protein